MPYATIQPPFTFKLREMPKKELRRYKPKRRSVGAAEEIIQSRSSKQRHDAGRHDL